MLVAARTMGEIGGRRWLGGLRSIAQCPAADRRRIGNITVTNCWRIARMSAAKLGSYGAFSGQPPL